MQTIRMTDGTRGSPPLHEGHERIQGECQQCR